MRKILPFKSSSSHYQADVCLVWCFDHRFRAVRNAFLRKRGYKASDVVTVGGGAKSLASKSPATSKHFIIVDQILTSIRLHHTKRIVLMVHSDCGAYGGVAAFGGDRKKEIAHHTKELKAAKKFLSRYLPKPVKIELVFADFDGLWQV